MNMHAKKSVSYKLDNHKTLSSNVNLKLYINIIRIIVVVLEAMYLSPLAFTAAVMVYSTYARMYK